MKFAGNCLVCLLAPTAENKNYQQSLAPQGVISQSHKMHFIINLYIMFGAREVNNT